jgi:hypothetical protein
MKRCTEAEIAALMAAQHGAIHRRDARRLGASNCVIRARLADGRWVEDLPGVLAVAGAPDSDERRLLACVLTAPNGSVASHRAAARLHGIPGFSNAPGELLVPRPRREKDQVKGAFVHHTTRLPDWQRKLLNAIPTTTVARTLFGLGAVVPIGRAERAVDNCLARRMVTIPALWRVLDDLAIQGRNGTCALREILMERGDGYVAPASELERQFLEIVRNAGLPEPAREVDLGDADQWIGRVEFVYREQRLLVEIDSNLHHTALLDVTNDHDRDNRFVAEGFRVLRFTEKTLTTKPRGVERTLRRALQPLLMY